MTALSPMVLVIALAWGTMTGTWCWLVTAARRQPPSHSSVRAETVGRRTCRAGWRAKRRFGVVVATVATAVLVHPALAPAPAGALWLQPRIQQRRTARRNLAAVTEQVPDVIDLLRLTTLAGLPVGAALLAIGDRPGGVVGAALAEAAGRLAGGAPTSDALASLSLSCGPPMRPLVDVLVDHDRYGTPLSPALDRVGIEARLQRRRLAEEAARRLPVTLLFPLVFTTLPACGLLTVIPLLVASLSSLQP